MNFKIIKRPDGTYYFTVFVNSASVVYSSYEEALAEVSKLKESLLSLNSLCLEEVVYDSDQDKLATLVREDIISGIRITE